MSRHRTTMKMHRVRDKQRENTTAAKTNEAAQSTPADSADETSEEAGNEIVASPDRVSRETLERYLATEAAEREASEERTSTTLARYFKVSLVMAGLNMVVAGISVSLLFSHSDRVQTVVAAPPLSQPSHSVPSLPAASPAPMPVPPAPVPAAATIPVTAEPAPATPTTTTPVTEAEAPAKPAKIKLLGESHSPIRKRRSATPPTRAQRLVSRPAPVMTSPSEPLPSLAPSPPRSVVLAKSPDEEYKATQMAERW
jgi:hypothetical protein